MEGVGEERGWAEEEITSPGYSIGQVSDRCLICVSAHPAVSKSQSPSEIFSGFQSSSSIPTRFTRFSSQVHQ